MQDILQHNHARERSSKKATRDLRLRSNDMLITDYLAFQILPKWQKIMDNGQYNELIIA